LSFNVKNGDLDIRWQLRHKLLKELEMDNLVFSRRKVLGQMAVSAAGILSLSATNKVFADDERYPYIHASVSYRMPTPSQSWPAVGAVVTIQCDQRRITLSGLTDITGKAMFNLHNYFHGQRDKSSIWKVTVNFRGQIQEREYRTGSNWSYINSVWQFYPLNIPSNRDLRTTR